MRRVLSRDRPDLDEGWLCDKGRFAYEHVRADDRYATPLVRGDRGLDEATLGGTRPRPSRAACATTRTCTAPDAVAVVASGEQSNEEAFAWREVVEAAGGGALVGSGRPWELLDPYRATIADLDAADVIVIAGDREPRDLAGVIELRIRKAVRRGAQLILAGAGGHAARPARERAHRDGARRGRRAAPTRSSSGWPLPSARCCSSPIRCRSSSSRRSPRAAGSPASPAASCRCPRRRTSSACAPPASATTRVERARPRRARRAAHAGAARRRRSRVARPARDRWRAGAAARRVGRRVVAVPERGDALGPRDPARDGDAREGGLDHEPRGPRRSGFARRSRRRPASISELVVPRRARAASSSAPLPDARAGGPPPARRRRARALPRLGDDRRSGAPRGTERQGRAAVRAPQGARRRSRRPGALQVVAYRPLDLGPGRRARRAPALPAARRDRARARRRRTARPRRGSAGRRGRARRRPHAAARSQISRTQQTGAVRFPWLGAPVAGTATVEAAS